MTAAVRGGPLAAVLGQPFGIGLTALQAGPQPAVPSAADQASPAAAASDQPGAMDSIGGDSPASVAAIDGGPALSGSFTGSVPEGSQASATDSLVGQTESMPAPQSGSAIPSPETGLANEPGHDEGRQGRRVRFEDGSTAQFSRKPPRFPPRAAGTFAPSHNRPVLNRVSASGDDADPVTGKGQDHATSTTQADPTTHSSKESPNEQTTDQMPGGYDAGISADQVPGPNATGLRKGVHPVAAPSAPKKEQAVGSTRPSGRFRLFGQEFVAPWNSRAAGVGTTLSAYGRAARVAASGALAGAAGGAAAGFTVEAAIGAVGGATAGGVGALPGAAGGAAVGVRIGTIGGAISGLLGAATAKSEADAANQAVVSGAITGIAGPVGGKVGGAAAGRVMAAGGSARVAGAVGGGAGSAAASAVGQTGAIAVGQQPGYSGTQFLVDVGMGTALGARAGAKAEAGVEAGPDTQGTAQVPESTPVGEPEVNPRLKAETTPVSDTSATPQQPVSGGAVSKTTRLDLGGKGFGDGAFITTTGDTAVVRVVSIETVEDMAKIFQAARQAGATKGTLFTGRVTDEVELIRYQRLARSGGTRFGGKITQLSENTVRLDFDEWPTLTD